MLWCLAIRHAVRTGELDLRQGLAELPEPRAEVWSQRIDVAETSTPSDFAHNGWVVEALQAAWCAISTTPVPADEPAAGTFRAQHLQHALEAAVRGGHDTDTVAAIAGGLLGAAHGASAVPAHWRRALHGWPGLRAQDLIRLGLQITRRGRSGWPEVATMDYSGWGDRGTMTRHPADDKVWLAGVDALSSPPAGVDAVVSLCRIGRDQTPTGVRPEDHVIVWLIDADDPEADNPNLGFVLQDTVPSCATCALRGAPCCCTASRLRPARPRSPRSSPSVIKDRSTTLLTTSREFSRTSIVNECSGSSPRRAVSSLPLPTDEICFQIREPPPLMRQVTADERQVDLATRLPQPPAKTFAFDA